MNRRKASHSSSEKKKDTKTKIDQYSALKLKLFVESMYLILYYGSMTWSYIFTLMLSSCGLAIGIISYQVTSFEYIVVFKLENFYVH